MSRPTKLLEVKDRWNLLAEFHLDQALTNPAIMKHYAALIDAVKKEGGRVVKRYGTEMRVEVLKSAEEMREQLERDQHRWDEMDQLYRQALDREPGSTDLRESQREALIQWAEREERPNPFDVFAANDPELEAIRKQLGMHA
jgi:hypothetical protein